MLTALSCFWQLGSQAKIFTGDAQLLCCHRRRHQDGWLQLKGRPCRNMKAWYAPQPMTANFLPHWFALRLHTSLGTGMKNSICVETGARASCFKTNVETWKPLFWSAAVMKASLVRFLLPSKWSLKGWIENHFQRGSPIFVDSTKRYWGILPLTMLFLYTSLVVIRKDVQKKHLINAPG